MQVLKYFWLNKVLFCSKKLFGCGNQCLLPNPQFWSLLCWTDYSKQIPWFMREQCGVPMGFLLYCSCQLQTSVIGYNVLPLKKPESEVLCLHFQSVLQNSVVKTYILRIERCGDKNVYWLTLQKLLSAFLTLLPVVWEKNLGRNIKNYLEIKIRSLVKIGYISLNMLLFHSEQQISISKN